MRAGSRKLSYGLFLILSILLYSCNMPGASPTPAPEESPTVTPDEVVQNQSVGPDVGTLMSWVDGNTLVFNGDTWIYLSEVSYYQFSLCVEAGICKPEEDEKLAMEQALLDPELATQPMPMKAQGVSDPCVIQYCGWAGGRVLTEAENAVISEDSGSPFAETVHGFKCVIDSPHPQAAACETSAFYLNGAPPEMDHTVEQAGAFCQNGESFVTLDINLMEGAVIQSVDGACELLDDNRVLCSGEPGTNLDGLAFFSCDELPAVQDNSAPAGGQLQCLPGYEPNIESPATCSIVGPDHSMQDHPLVGQVSLIEYKVNDGLFQDDSPDCGPFLHFDEVLGLCVADIELDDLALAGGPLDCDFGFTYDETTGLCLPDMSGWTPPSENTDCGIGYRFDEEAGICMPELSGVPTSTPCLAGMTLNEATGLCEPGTSGLPSPARCVGPLIFNEATGRCEVSLGGWRPPTGQTTCGEGFRLDPATGACVPNLSGVPTGPRCLGGMTLNEATGLCEPNTSGWHPPSGQRTCGAWFRFDEATGTCVPDVSGVSSPPSCLGGMILNKSTGFCELPMLGCPVGTYYDPSMKECIAYETPSNDPLAGFHFDEAMQCSQSDLPSGRYPGCPDGQAYDPLTGACDSENTWLKDGKRIYAVEFNFSAPACDAKNSGGAEGGASGVACSSYGDKDSCNKAGCSWDAVKNTCN